ncbi:MAG: hypothetical protein KIT54_02300 [Phycisphaeraceae bacterium]|nr:hypothetical protein [Phycisphaeraceae bacterium]
MMLESSGMGPSLRLVGTPRGVGATALHPGNIRQGGGNAARLVAGISTEPAVAPGLGVDPRELEVARMNRRAASLDAADARWVLACRVAVSLEGGRAAILRPEARDRLLVQADRMGLRAFDANLIIAIVQDSARCGLEPLGLPTAERVPLVRPAHTARPADLPMLARLGIAMAVGATLAAVAIRWILA